MRPERDSPKATKRVERKPLQFSLYGFKPRDWERERIHRYSVNRPLWWKAWMRLREAGARLGIS